MTASREVRSGVEMGPGGSSAQLGSEALEEVRLGLTVQHQVLH